MKHQLTTPAGALAALFFLPGQYLLKSRRAGREVTKPLLSEQLARAFCEFSVDTGWQSRPILRYREDPHGNSLISYEPPAVRSILVVDKAGQTREISVPLPPLILVGRGRDYFLWAAKGKIAPETKICFAPLPNVGGELGGRICFGTNDAGEASARNIDAVWDLIWKTPFNGDHSAGKCVSEPDDVRNLWLKLAERKARRFPSRELIETETTVAEIWRRITEKL